MSLYVALQMDPIGHVSITADSTFRIGLEAEAAGAPAVPVYRRPASYDEGRVIARGRPVDAAACEQGDHVSFGDWTEVELAEFDVVWLRQDPPFDMGYVTSTHLLDRMPARDMVVNDPFWVRNSPEKLMVLDFPDLTPPTMIARDRPRSVPSRRGTARSS